MIRVQYLNIGVGYDVTSCDNTGTFFDNPYIARLMAMEFDQNPFEVENDIRDILRHSWNRRKLVQYSLDAYRCDRRPL